MRYVIELRRTDDDRVEGFLIRDGLATAAAFSGWMELLSLLQPPPLEVHDLPAAEVAQTWPDPGGL